MNSGWKNKETWEAYMELSNTYWMYQGVKQLIFVCENPEELSKRLKYRYQGSSKEIDFDEIAKVFFLNEKGKEQK